MKSSTGQTIVNGRILEIQRMSTEDGPGLRTTVFLKGCSLQCTWCHNPESISPKPEVQWIGTKCIGCGSCVAVCRENALSRDSDGTITVNREKCTACLQCSSECPSGALEALGTIWDAEVLAAELVKDREYFFKSGGGVSFGGGEPLLQAEFIEAAAGALKKQGIRTAVDTCGNVHSEAFLRVLPEVDLVLYDLKIMNPEDHLTFTGSGNKKILENILLLKKYSETHPRHPDLWIRTPVIPFATDSENNIRAIGKFIKDHLHGLVSRWELLSFNHLCADKYIRLGRVWQYADKHLYTRGQMERLTAAAGDALSDNETVQWSGQTGEFIDEKNN